MKGVKPLGRKTYGSIPHLPQSRMGPSDHKCSEGQARIATVQVRDKHDTVIVQEKLDGSCVGVVLLDGKILALGRKGYLAETSPYLQHRLFAKWVGENEHRFRAVLKEGERLVGEWMAQAHGTLYRLHHEPFVAFDLMVGHVRLPFLDFLVRVEKGDFETPNVLNMADGFNTAFSIKDAMYLLSKPNPICEDEFGWHGALERCEGAVWRVERNKLVDRHSGQRKQAVDFLVKYVRPDKVDGKYLDEESGPRWNEGLEEYVEVEHESR